MSSPATPEPAPHSPFDLEPLALLGAVTGQFVHDIANEITSASTVISLLHDTKPGSLPLKEDMDDLIAAINQSIVLIHHFGDTVRSLRPPPGRVPLNAVIEHIRTVAAANPQIPVEVGTLESGSEVVCNTGWLAHCVRFFLHEFAAEKVSGAITLSVIPVAQATPPVEYYPIEKSTHYFVAAFAFGAEPRVSFQPQAKYGSDLPAFVVRELLRQMRGFVQHTDADKNRILLCLPCH